MTSPLLTPEQVAEILNISVRYVWRLGREGQLERVKVGKYVRFTKEGVHAFIERGRERPVAPTSILRQVEHGRRRRFRQEAA